MEQKFCKKCKAAILESYSFCPSCGIKVKDVCDISVGKQIGLYLLSVFLPPLGLFPGLRYLKNENETAKHIGLILIFLTILSSIISVWMFFGVINTINKTINEQLNMQNLGL